MTTPAARAIWRLACWGAVSTRNNYISARIMHKPLIPASISNRVIRPDDLDPARQFSIDLDLEQVFDYDICEVLRAICFNDPRTSEALPGGCMSIEKNGVDVDTAIVFTPNMTELAEFYREGFSLPAPQAHGEAHLGFQVGRLYLGFDQVDEAEDISLWGTTLWFRVDDIQATFDRLVEMGAEVRFPPEDKPMGDRLAAVIDPDGNMVGLAQRRSD